MYSIPAVATNEQSRNTKPFAASIIVTSDTCCKDESKDQSGAYLLEELNRENDLFSQVTKRCVADDRKAILECLKVSLFEDDPALVITVGGTGLTPRDVTPDSISPLYERRCSGIEAALHMTSLRYSPHAALSRLTAGTIGDCLVINFPGSPKACKDSWACVKLFIEHALDQVRFNATAYSVTHLKLQEAASGSLERQKASSEAALSPIVLPLNNGSLVGGERNRRPSIDSSNSNSSLIKKKYFAQRGASVEKLTPGFTSQLANQISRLSIKEIQDSRIEQHSVSHRMDKKSLTKKYTSLDDLRRPQLSHHQHKQPSHDHQKYNYKLNQQQQVVPQIPSTRVQPTHSQYELINFITAHEILGSLSAELLHEQEEVILNNFDAVYKLIGRVLAQDLISRHLIPPHSVSTVDGYVAHIPPALRKATGNIKVLPPCKVLANLEDFKCYQAHPQMAQTFFCYRVNTGGRLPDKNFAVVPIENTEQIPSSTDQMQINYPKPGEYQRKAGSDMCASDKLTRGTVIGPVEMSLIISMGHKRVRVFKTPRIGVLSTGDEIVNFFKSEAGPNQVADTNGPLLTTVFRQRGYFSYNYGIVKDDPNCILASMTHALKSTDILIVTGGASMGEKDFVKDVIKHMGGTIHFGRVNIKPGKPAAFASLVMDNSKKFIFSLPGNPVSAYITSMLLVLPFIVHGIENHFQPEGTLSLDCVGEFVKVTVAKLTDGDAYPFDGRFEFVRAKITSRAPDYQVVVSMKQQSSRLLSLKDFNCLIMIDPAMKNQRFEVGSTYTALKIDRPL